MAEPSGATPVRTDADVFRAVYPRVRRFAGVVASPGIEPDDLVQEALTKALARGGLTWMDDPTAYLCRSVLNLALNGRRSAGRQKRLLRLLSGGQADAAHADYPSDLADLLVLDQGDRAVLYLADVENVPFAMIAEIVDSREATVRGRASRARRSLRAELKREGEIK